MAQPAAHPVDETAIADPLRPAEKQPLLLDRLCATTGRHQGVTVEVGNETFPAKATVVSDKKRDEMYAKQASAYPGYAGYEQKTTRKIPVVELVRPQ